MADQDFNRTPLYPLEKPLADDINQGFAQADRSLRDVMSTVFSARSGFPGAALLVKPSTPAALSVVMTAGTAFQVNGADVPVAIGGVVGLDDLSPYKPIVLANDLTIAVPAPPGSNSRIDLIEVRYNRAITNPQSRDFLDPLTGSFSPASVGKTLDFSIDGSIGFYAAAATPTTAIAYKSGVAGVSPSPPATDSGYLAVAYVTVATGTTTILAADIADARAFLGLGGYIGSQDFFTSGTYTPTPGVTRVVLRQVGGGGGAGGITGGGGFASATGGGASGTYTQNEIDGPITGGAVTIGGGGGGGGPGATGGTGGDTTVVINGVTYVAKGGLGSSGKTAVITGDIGLGGDHQTGSTAFRGSYQAGSPGTMGVALTPGVQLGGNGGSNPFGGGGLGKVFVTGSSGRGFGGGGGGTATSGAVNVNGGPGAPGFVMVDEYI